METFLFSLKPQGQHCEQIKLCSVLVQSVRGGSLIVLSVSLLPSFITVGSGRRGVGGAGRPPGGQQFLSSESGLQSLKAVKFISADSGKPSLGKDIPTEQLLLNTL